MVAIEQAHDVDRESIRPLVLEEMNRPTGPHIKDDIGDLDIHLEGCILEAKYMGMVMW